MAGRRFILGVTPALVAVLALGGAASAQSPAPSAPAASVDPAAQAGVDALLAVFPATVNDETLDVSTETGADLLSSLPPEALGAITAALDAQGKTATDVTAAIAYTSNGSLIAALRVAGADANAFVEPFLGALIPPGAEVVHGTATLGDRAVTTVATEVGTIYVYPSGDVVWLVGMDEAGATQLIATLP